ncbi:MAG TPA: AIR synthase-related protein, partial [Gemmatimonadales bacterium]
RPQVQVGDPLTEKLLLEASLELIASGHIVAIQDMGAAGLTSSSAEMAARGGVGVEIDTAQVPTRESGMTPYEILLSESQERMLVVARHDRVAQVAAIAERWELTAVPIGRVTADGLYRVKHGAITVAEIPGRELVDDCPIYRPEAKESADAVARRAAKPARTDVPVRDALLKLLDTPSLASKRWVFEQYDSTIQAATIVGPGGDGGVILVPDAKFGLAVSTDCNSRYVLLDPLEGGRAAVAEAARNVACTGARPIGMTNCLNFGSPEKPAVFFQFREACRGMSEACKALDTPVTGGNVSFYNESPTGAVDPTPVVGMVGLLDDATRAVGAHFSATGDAVILLGTTRGHLGGSSYWAHVLDTVAGAPPPVDLAAERRLVDLLVELASRGLVASAHDLSDGGLAVALAEACIGAPYAEHSFGAEVDLKDIQGTLSPTGLLFGEDHGRAVISVRPAQRAAVLALAGEHMVPAAVIGAVGDRDSRLRVALRSERLDLTVKELKATYDGAIPRRMAAVISAEAAD